MTLKEIHFFILIHAFIALYKLNLLFTLLQMMKMHFLARNLDSEPLVHDRGRGRDKGRIGSNKPAKGQVRIDFYILGLLVMMGLLS